jgi:EAL domain-containing protein (putative c-di-GMP-specific phosphodiesterase class I)
MPIGEWVLRSACRQARAWQDAGLEMTVAVNMSHLQFRQKNLVQSVSTALELAELEPHYLEIEISESVLMDRSDAVADTMQVLRRMGVKLAIDNFGTGYSSLSFLRHFPIDKLKIDQSFLRGLKNDIGDAAIVRAILVMAKSMKLKVSAEGVETDDQLAFLGEQGCDEFQGNFLARPARASEMMRFGGKE